MRTFRDRREAGRLLGERLRRRRLPAPVVFGLPRGGVPVAAEVAALLDAPLDVVVVRKLGCPWQPELGVGAIGEDGIRVVDRHLVRHLGIRREALDEVVAREQTELRRRVERYRGGRAHADVRGGTAVVVDDGIATGSTMRAALDVVRLWAPARLVLAVPVAPPHTLSSLAPLVDATVCLVATEAFGAVGQFYDDFAQTTDDEVVAALAAAPAPTRRRAPGHRPGRVPL